MDVSIFLETERVLTRLDEEGNEIQIAFPRKAPAEKPLFIDDRFQSLPMVYVNDQVFKENPEALLAKIADYIRGLPEVDAISVAASFFKEPVISAMQEAKKKGISITGNYTLKKEEYEKFKDVEVINVDACEDSLLEQLNIYLTARIGYQGNHPFSSGDKIKDAKKQEYLDIKEPLTSEMGHDLELFFKWNTHLKRLELSQMTPGQYLEIIEFLKPFLSKIPQIRIGMNIKNNCVEEMKQLSELLGAQSEKIIVQYGTHLDETEQFKKTCSLKEYIVMDEILSSYQAAIESHEYSPLEKLIYAYDIVKNADYKEASDDKQNSRNLHSVVLGGEIVCVGYSNLLNGLLTKLGIPATEYGISVYRTPEVEEAHQRSAIYLQDSKYGINGLFICDPTWDARSATDLGYDRPIDRYNYFLLPYDQMKYSKVPENVNAFSALFVKQEYLEIMNHYNIYQHGLIEINKALGVIDVSGVIDEESEEFKALPYCERDKVKRNALYTYIRERISNFRQEVPFDVIASAIETVRRTEGVYQSEAELGSAIAKIRALHEQFKSLAFSDTEKSLYIEQDGKFQVLYTPVEQKLEQAKTA